VPIFRSLKCDPERSIHPTASKCGSAANNVRIAVYVTLALQCLVLLSASLFEAQNGTKIGYEFLVLQVLIFLSISVGTLNLGTLLGHISVF